MSTKIFGIGLNKTGTKSLGIYLKLLGYKRFCKANIKYIRMARNDIGGIFKIVDEFEVFEDWPWPLIYKQLYDEYPSSKFILTVRKNPEEWYGSLVRHSRKTGPTEQRLAVYGYYSPNDENKSAHLRYYQNHINEVINFFETHDRTRLLILSTDESKKEQKICDFIGKPRNSRVKYPHLNRSKKL